MGKKNKLESLATGKCQSISECFLIGNVSLYWDDTYRTNAKPVQYEYTHKGEGRLNSFCQILEDLHNDAFFFSPHYSIQRAWTTVPLFIESDGTMLHLNLWLWHHGIVPSLVLYHLHFYDFTSTALLNSNYGAKRINKNNKRWLICIGSAAQYRSYVWNVYARFGRLRKTVLHFMSLFYCFFRVIVLLEMKSSLCLCMCFVFFSEGVVRFYKHKNTRTHTQAKWCLDIRENMHS